MVAVTGLPYNGGMNLNAFTAEKRLALFDQLRAGLLPGEGTYDAASLSQAKVKGSPQLGTTRYEPNAIHIEFIYPDPLTSSSIVTITLTPPERIVFLPVPDWVVETIWQGEISGTFVFESEANAQYQALGKELTPESNLKWFGPQMAKRRE